ncbi:MAG: hypothetical protein A2X61_15320 [Ignavibacteria bacterium GWB2_35_12]|nr:MAG: hypothetical protein A2X63_03275 [Ignavibacteria bacterium GWA2_35_8]OGU38784.1 MAG: hypothetical protein A2X61_15320 [Ignavibacteria bacterium GWB2_35_12]OGV20306.1 MAG: hypothetical protein A2475_12485 [Ignavibacteria bacterium RIFOXYC2_FULL_35_21]
MKIDFPRIPFTSDYSLFKKISELGQKLSDFHLSYENIINKPISKYPVISKNDTIEKVYYDDVQQRVYINKEKYFTNVTPELWNYHIGGYQILKKYLDWRKGRIMDFDKYYCQMITAIAKTIELQNKIDEIYNKIEENVIEF